jgi:hypothetical protein
MPQRCPTDPLLSALLQFQDFVIHRDQALTHGLTPRAVKHRLATAEWRMLLPKVYIVQRAEPSRRQMMIGALLFAGPDAAIDAADACRFHGIKAVRIDDELVHLVVPWGSSARSRGFVVVRRTLVPMSVVATEQLRYLDPAAAVIAATRSMNRERSVLAALSDALQRRVTTYEALVRAHVQGPPRNSAYADDALEALGDGIRSAPEADFRELVLASTVLPAVDYNVWLRLSDRRVLCVDALIRSSALIHETNGRTAHRREDLFEDMQERGDALVVEGFAVLNNSPRRIRLRGREVIAQVERLHLANDGRGMPAGVEILSEGCFGGL